MMVDGLLLPLSIKLLNSQEDHLNEGNELSKDQPDVHHPDIGGGGQLPHHTDEQGGHHQHHSQVDCQGSLKEEGFEECGAVGDAKEEDGGEVGGQQFIGQSSLEHQLHGHSFLHMVYKSETRRVSRPRCYAISGSPVSGVTNSDFDCFILIRSPLTIILIFF